MAARRQNSIPLSKPGTSGLSMFQRLCKDKFPVIGLEQDKFQVRYA